MADNIRNFSDYRKNDRNKKEKREEFATEEINSIEIQDPLDFLSAEEREEYYRTQHAAMDKERESLKEDSPEFYFDDEDSVPVKKEPVRKKERQPEPERPVKKSVASKKDKKRASKPVKEEKRAFRKRAREEAFEDFEDEEENVSGIDPMLIVRISSIVTGLIILVLIGMIFKSKVYDRFLIPDPDNTTKETEIGELAGYTRTDDKIVTTADLNLRNTPSTASDSFIVVQVPKGTTLDRVAVSDDGEWAQIKYDDKLLFCVMKYVAVQE